MDNQTSSPAETKLDAVRDRTAEALFKVEGVHHVHGQQCICGFASAVSRDRTKHLMEATLEASEFVRLIEAIEAVGELHRPIESGDERIVGYVCAECSAVDDEEYTFYPCTTVEAVIEALEVSK